MPPTKRLFWQDDHRLSTTATIADVRDNRIAFDQTIFYPGGGGQPSDQGTFTAAGVHHSVTEVEIGSDGVLWHLCAESLPANLTGQTAVLHIDEARRIAHSRYHTVLHVLNTIALRDYAAWITGAQIGTDYARIDFKWDGFSQAVRSGLEEKVNAVLDANQAIASSFLSEAEFATRPDLLRTLEAKPPVIDGLARR